ncbi:MAG: phosphate signaling complex protein PhoU [Gillisia sp.]
MVNIDPRKDLLNQLGTEMFNLCKMQLENSIEAYLKQDKDLAEYVIYREYRVHALVLNLDHECEQFLTLHQPVGNDLKFIMVLRKIIYDLKCIGDHALSISRYIAESDLLPDEKLLKRLSLDEMFSCVTSMLEDIQEAYLDQDNQRAHKVFMKQHKLNEINCNIISVISVLMKNEVNLIDQSLLLFTVIKKIERVGDLSTNIAQEIIFYRELVVNPKAKFSL